ncbi:NAD(P)-dependent alcohol dehydrogenase [Pedobacter sp. KBW06]|uniref:zinc-dependent alcohol dehydrogenase family protein n=1 Tax=Pedobacter sp. KBW06 TaxID=2153359 RepID=UPI000F5943E5|nr:NAD(P)-dependent alcohol dehydrogenase [Pedobacter sp. KBW06]RQO65903.1 NAD(P)-dependent alcohol dehydrogenase [Pedobacter sp. KBW06]
MKAVQLTRFGIENLIVNELESPSPLDHEVLVRIKAVSLNYLDTIIARGSFSNELNFPYIPASDGSGIVESVGKNVTRWKTGDRVAIQYVQKWTKGNIDKESNSIRVAWQTPGVMAEYVCIPEYGLVKAPDNLSFEETATLPIAALTAWHGLINQANLQLGQTVLTQGTGGVSLFALQIAKAAGARVIATTSSDEKAGRLKAIGADEIINYAQNPDWHQEVLSLTNGEGVDITLDIAGTKTIEQSLLSIKENGFVGTAGFISGTELPLDIHRHKINMSFLRIQGLAVGSAESFSALNRAIELTNLHPIIDEVFTIDQVKDAYRKLEEGRHFGKIVISI